jgi:hypothetical protein
MALKLVDKGQVGKAAHILNSQGLAVVNDTTMKQLLALFPGATLLCTAAADLPEQMSSLPVARDEAAQSQTPRASQCQSPRHSAQRRMAQTMT